jgi:hypothetical protein
MSNCKRCGCVIVNASDSVEAIVVDHQGEMEAELHKLEDTLEFKSPAVEVTSADVVVTDEMLKPDSLDDSDSGSDSDSDSDSESGPNKFQRTDGAFNDESPSNSQPTERPTSPVFKGSSMFVNFKTEGKAADEIISVSMPHSFGSLSPSISKCVDIIQTPSPLRQTVKGYQLDYDAKLEVVFDTDTQTDDVLLDQQSLVASSH